MPYPDLGGARSALAVNPCDSMDSGSQALSSWCNDAVQSKEIELLFPSALNSRAWMYYFLECEGSFAGTVGVAALQRSNPFS